MPVASGIPMVVGWMLTSAPGTSECGWPRRSGPRRGERPVRHFKRTRRLSVDGRVGEEMYRALAEARWSLGDRLLQSQLRPQDALQLADQLPGLLKLLQGPRGILPAGRDRPGPLD
jgi:hypothetical protein